MQRTKETKMSDEDGKQLSIEEAVENVEPRPKEHVTEKERDDRTDKDTKEAVRKARATNKNNSTQLAIEETVGEAANTTKKPSTRLQSSRRKV
jgi:arginyl-tRNA synthetase